MMNSHGHPHRWACTWRGAIVCVHITLAIQAVIRIHCFMTPIPTAAIVDGSIVDSVGSKDNVAALPLPLLPVDYEPRSPLLIPSKRHANETSTPCLRVLGMTS